MSQSMRRIALALALLASLACATGKKSRLATPQEPQRKASVVDFYNEGKEWYIGVSVAASRIAGPQNMLPLNLVIVDKNAGDQSINRENIVLETPDGKLLPVATYDQFKEDYARDRPDANAGKEFVERHEGRFPEPPFQWKALDYFPLRNTSTVPRNTMQLRESELVHGYVYFAAPAPGYVFPKGKYKLLITPQPSNETLVVELFPY